MLSYLPCSDNNDIFASISEISNSTTAISDSILEIVNQYPNEFLDNLQKEKCMSLEKIN